MAKDPAFLFYHQDFFTGVSDMTNEEVGAYIKCLCIQASKGGITEKHMLIICQSQEVHNLVKNKFVFNSEINLLENLRLKIEIEKRKKYSESRSANRKKGINQTKKEVVLSKSYVQHMENENEIENEDVIEVKNVKEIFNFKKSLIDYGFEENLVSEWMQVRKNKKATNTKTTFQKFIKEIELTPEDKNYILKLIIEKDWKSFEYQWYLNLKNQKEKLPEPQKEQMFGRMTQSTVEKNYQTFLNAYPDGK